MCQIREGVRVFRTYQVSATLCENEILMFWEVCWIGSEVIGLLWNLALFGILHRVIISRVICFLDCTLLVTIVSVSCFRLLFLTIGFVSNTQDINSTSSWVYDQIHHVQAVEAFKKKETSKQMCDFCLSVLFCTVQQYYISCGERVDIQNSNQNFHHTTAVMH